MAEAVFRHGAVRNFWHPEESTVIAYDTWPMHGTWEGTLCIRIPGRSDIHDSPCREDFVLRRLLEEIPKVVEAIKAALCEGSESDG